MNNFLKISFLLLSILLISCGKQEPRRPISHGSGSFLKESIERNKKLNSIEEAMIDSIISKNPEKKFYASTKGYWYYYDIQKTTDTLTPKRGDVAYFDYEIKDFNDNVIYSEVELRPQIYLVDKQDILIGLRDGIKLMSKGEKITFLLPSNMAYGFRGDNDRIPPNLPIICTVTLNDIKPEAEARKQNKTTQE